MIETSIHLRQKYLMLISDDLFPPEFIPSSRRDWWMARTKRDLLIVAHRKQQQEASAAIHDPCVDLVTACIYNINKAS